MYMHILLSQTTQFFSCMKQLQHLSSLSSDSACYDCKFIICLRFGLKGKVDVTVSLKEQRNHGKVVVAEKVPLELKTGRMFYKQGTVEHRAQVCEV